jgi:ribosomal protein S18 acetylase RimI-like enzyme
MASGGSVCYFKRYKMELDLHDLPAGYLPPGFACLPWSAELLEAHAQVLYGSFNQEIDANVFPSLSTPDGCRMLMTEISRKWGFLPGATWLLIGAAGPCGTVQGVRERSGLGAIQNLGILPSWRNRGLGRGLLLYALHGFWAAALGRALLEVTAQNDGAIRLYRRLGFRRRKTLYKAVGEQRAGIPAPLL